ncbi:MAG: DUF3006 domain-containing protein [Clostridia bacterium]|nr:DUF3006 domain-containing protein [Clostridia bacterium]
MKMYIIDRFEGDFAVCENYNIDEDSDIKIENIKKELIPEDAKEGDIIVVNNDNQIYIDYQQTKIRKQKIEELRKRLTKNKEN